MKNLSSTIFMLSISFISCKVSERHKSDSKNKPFNGRITFHVVTSIKNEQRFDEELSSYIEFRDSLYNLNHQSDVAWKDVNEPTIRLMLDPREDPRSGNSYFSPFEYKYQFTDTLVTYNYRSGSTAYKVDINTRTQDYVRYNLRTNRIINTKKYEFFINKLSYKEFVYKDSLKKIQGFECYKVLVIEDYIDDNLKGLNTYKEMYVTSEINSLYHPFQIREALLKKYYPLQIKFYSDFLSDKETYYKVKSIESVSNR